MMETYPISGKWHIKTINWVALKFIIFVFCGKADKHRQKSYLSSLFVVCATTTGTINKTCVQRKLQKSAEINKNYNLKRWHCTWRPWLWTIKICTLIVIFFFFSYERLWPKKMQNPSSFILIIRSRGKI